MIFFLFFILFVILQRLSELLIAKKNKLLLFSNGAVEYDKGGYKFIVLMHVLFFISLVTEKIFLNRELNQLWVVFIIIFLAAQFLRYWAIISLGKYWNTRIIVLQGAKQIKSGPYRFLKHPNYLAVLTELAIIPLIFSCYFTSVIFTILNLIILSRRVKIEEKALNSPS